MNSYKHTWDSLDLLVDTDPLRLRDLAYTYLNDCREAQRLLFKTAQSLQKCKDEASVSIKEIHGFLNSITA